MTVKTHQHPETIQSISPLSKVSGRIHSIETCGTVDGPGIRFIIFTQGCCLRCLYCHNPDTRNLEDGREITVDELIAEIQKYRSYMRFSGGGITISGGEPLVQPDFVQAIFQRCQEIGIHTALDTSGFVNLTIAKPVLEFVDLVLLDIKSFNPLTYRQVTGTSIEPTLRFAQYLNEINKPTWIRFVLVPNLTDDPDNIEGLAKFISQLKNVEKVELSPFHKLGEYKWEKLGYTYRLQDTPVPTSEQIHQVKDCFRRYGLSVQ